ncbi:CFC_HP_G0101650.mRNA.1.CDS.1 [Saccharomyces cerevisiae]|nr:CFC_HP_G0101650.mRNA.1.CDS.1 [Saccharomyces cerevisiae]CAI6900694.1 CFC_HP_G0101650.mRNA.1.CDS.1 [Saccharomyces cerevisiae]
MDHQDDTAQTVSEAEQFGLEWFHFEVFPQTNTGELLKSCKTELLGCFMTGDGVNDAPSWKKADTCNVKNTFYVLRIVLSLHLEIFLGLWIAILDNSLNIDLIVFIAIFADVATLAIAYIILLTLQSPLNGTYQIMGYIYYLR